MDSIDAFLLRFWEKVNAFCSRPMTALVAIVGSCIWLACSVFTGGHPLLDHSSGHWQFDPGGAFGSFIENQIQLVLLFVTCALGYKASTHAQAAHRHAKAARDVSEGNRRAIEHAHSRLDAIHEKIGPQVKETLSKC